LVKPKFKSLTKNIDGLLALCYNNVIIKFGLKKKRKKMSNIIYEKFKEACVFTGSEKAEQLGLEVLKSVKDVNLDFGEHKLLHLAAGAGNLKLLHALLDKGADVNIQSDNGSTALHYASTFGQSKMINELLSVGADPCISNDKGELPLHLFVRYLNSENVLERLDSMKIMEDQMRKQAFQPKKIKNNQNDCVQAALKGAQQFVR